MSGRITEVTGELLPPSQALEGRFALPPLKVSVSIGSGTSSEQAMAAVDSICEAMVRQTRSITYLRLTFGRFVKEIHRRKLYKPEFRSFEAYLASLDRKYGMKRTTVTEILTSINTFPKLEPEEAEDIPLQSLKLISQVVRNHELPPRQASALLADARKKTFSDLRDGIEERGLVGPSAGRPAGGNRTTGSVALRVVVSARAANRFRAISEERGLEPGKYLEYLMSLDRQKGQKAA